MNTVTLMGSFYTNYTLRGSSPQAVANLLAGRSALVSPEQDGCVVVFDEESDQQNMEIIAELGSRLSGDLQCPLLAVLNHDDDVLWYQLYVNGELQDEYDSTPGYFGDEDADEAVETDAPDIRAPEGGDAGKLCAAFGSEAVEEVQHILRKGILEEDGYPFAIERHAELAAALGLPGCAAGYSFEALLNGEIPEELAEARLLQTKELAPPSPPPPPGPWRRPVPGFYKISFRARHGLKASIPVGWMPGTWAELECAEADLTEAFRRAAAVSRQRFAELGFQEQGFKKLRRMLNPDTRDRGGINYLDRSRCHFGQLLYNRTHIPSLGVEKEALTIAFTAVFEDEVLSCTNGPQSPLESLPNHRVTRVKSNDVADIYRQFLALLDQHAGSPRPFVDVNALQAWFDANALQLFERSVQQGVLVRMSDYEVQKAWRKLPRESP